MSTLKPLADNDEIAHYEEALARYLDLELDAERFTALRLQQGVYGQRQEGVNMVRIKLPGGRLDPARAAHDVEVRPRRDADRVIDVPDAHRAHRHPRRGLRNVHLEAGEALRARCTPHGFPLDRARRRGLGRRYNVRRDPDGSRPVLKREVRGTPEVDRPAARCRLLRAALRRVEHLHILLGHVPPAGNPRLAAPPIRLAQRLGQARPQPVL